MKSHERKRKVDNTSAENVPNEKRLKERDEDRNTTVNMETDPVNIKGKCNWCTQMKELLPGKKFCQSCSENGRECRWCHRPLPERFYSKRTDVCDRCVDRRERWKSQTGGGKTALEGSVVTTELSPNPGNLWDILQFFIDNNDTLMSHLHDVLLSKRGIKWFMTLYVKFVKYNQSNEAVYAEPIFRSINQTLTKGAEIKEQLAKAYQNLYSSYQNFERDGSGWSIDKILKMEICTAEYTPLSGSSYIPLPPRIVKKKAVLNIQNLDQKCFLWSIIAALHPVSWGDHPTRVSNYTQYEREIVTEGLDFPTPLSQIAGFEQKNNISINVFGLEGNDIFPLHLTESRFTQHHVNLLLFSKGEKRHYCLIRNLSRLLGDRTSHDGETFYCNYCLHGFSRNDLLQEHIPYCLPKGPQKMTFPKSEEDQWVQFKHISKQLKVPFVIYLDLESLTVPIQSCSPNPNKSSTTPYQKHEACGFCYYVKCSDESKSKPAYVYRGPNAIDHLFECLLKEEEEISEILSHVEPMSLSKEDEISFHKAYDCHICEMPLGADRVRDHDHLSGKYRGAAHNHCNLQYQFKKGKKGVRSNFFIPVIAHNCRNYDLHHMMSAVGKYKDKKLSCIPNNMEKYISFSLDNLRFIDSIQFLNASLDTLVNNLAREGSSKFHNLSKHFPADNERDILLRKGVYPYDYMSSWDCFYDRKLPPITAFHNKLSESDISTSDYSHAINVWETFNMSTMGDYHDLYLKTDVLLLADVFENFRNICLDSYHLDPAHFYTSPGLAWEAMLKMSKVKLQLLDDIDMVLMIEKGVRGGVSMISKKFAKANNPMVPDYDSSKPNTWLTYLDMNNLYGTSMSEPLPERDFAWLSKEQIETLDVMNVSDTGYILDVDLEYPDYLHDTHSDYPLAPENKTITDDMLSPYTLKLKEKLAMKGSSTKLVPDLTAKKQYVLHYRNLKYYLSKGLILSKIHRVLEFTQSPWLKSYIDFNTEKRAQAKTDFEKDFYKLMNNSVFGKTMENMRKRMNVELVHKKERLRKVCAKPNFQSFKIFNEDLVAVNLRKTNIVLNRPIYAGFCILDIAKLFMFQFHYDFVKSKYGNKASLLFTDTDSLCYEIETHDFYKDMSEHISLFDTSNFEKEHYLYSKANCKVLGKMKDECGGRPIQTFVGLRPKMYSLQYDGLEKKTAKGVKKAVIDKHLKHTSYEQALFGHCSLTHSMNMIRSYNHQLYSVSINKTTLSPYDDKRYVLDTGIDTLAHGHFRIKS
ncbi:hypothetical protein FSP39_003181 [Pinctada imbricata]|uniref:DNA-directed DNA polymerase n=1 Tax=Pinctada imbricata TaxID=66713 RepID=A0AA89BVB7_PINIB|nr:hypothetical protein FSP39_003181 [Pinctada imbricata]